MVQRALAEADISINTITGAEEARLAGPAAVEVVRPGARLQEVKTQIAQDTFFVYMGNITSDQMEALSTLVARMGINYQLVTTLEFFTLPYPNDSSNQKKQ